MVLDGFMGKLFEGCLYCIILELLGNVSVNVFVFDTRKGGLSYSTRNVLNRLGQCSSNSLLQK